MPVTPFTTTFEIVLCQPVCSSIFARMPSARAVAQVMSSALVAVFQFTKSGQIVISSR